MNIYDYIISPDVADHCRKIGHVFNSLDMAVIVDISHKTIQEKHAAWREIIGNYPDMPIHESETFEAKESLHCFLRERIAGEKNFLADFYSPTPNTVYLPYICDYDYDSHTFVGCYSTMEKVWQAIRKDWKDLNWQEDKISHVKVVKGYIDDEDKKLDGEAGFPYVYLSADGEVFYYSEGYSKCSEFSDNLKDIFIHIPTPFAKGDLVDDDGKPHIIVHDLPHCWTEKETAYSYEDFVSGRAGNGFHMSAMTYYICNDGWLVHDHPRYHELKFFRGELKGRNQLLEYWSYYIKNKATTSLDWLMDTFRKHESEAVIEETNRKIDELKEELSRCRQCR